MDHVRTKAMSGQGMLLSALLAIVAMVSVALWPIDAQAAAFDPVQLPDPAFNAPLCVIFGLPAGASCGAGVITDASVVTFVGGGGIDRDDFSKTTTPGVTATANTTATPGADGIPFNAQSSARAQTGFGTHRASASASHGGQVTNSTGTTFDYSNSASGTSFWQDVWQFSQAGTFEADVAIGGIRRVPNSAPGFDAFNTPTSNISYIFDIWDTQFETEFCLPTTPPLCQTFTSVVKIAHFEIGVNGGLALDPGPFNQTVHLQFDFQGGNHHHVVNSYFSAGASEGTETDFFSTAQFGNVSVSNGTLSTLSTTDFLALGLPGETPPGGAVPEPATAAVLTLGGTLLAIVRRRRTS
jgi:hypothetical protein